MGTVVLHLLTEEMVTMRFAVFSIAFCMLVGLATATTIGLTNRPPWNQPIGFPSPYPRVLSMLLPVFPPGSKHGPRPITIVSARSGPSGSSGKSGDMKMKKKGKNRKNRKSKKSSKKNWRRYEKIYVIL
uniref:Uncharacterized protein n=1 Tax=Amblyomma americanum TaxID=6943 RepID=A0A0C9S4B9_AMBAM